MHMDGQRQKKSSWGEILHFFWKMLCDMFYPGRCPVCDEILEPELSARGIHRFCISELKPVSGAVCMQCGRPLANEAGEYCYDCQRMRQQDFGRGKEPAIRQGKSLYLYQGKIKETMYRFKYGNRREYAQFFAKQAQMCLGDWIQSREIEVIVPVPMYLPKQKKRGYNQAETFAKALGSRMKIPVDTTLIKRCRDTTPQKELNDIERKNNLKSAFQRTQNIVKYKNILVVDDIYTTGSTAMAVAETLRETDSCRIYFLSICIGGGM